MFNYRNQHIEVISWTPGQPWPEKISIDGREATYTAWQSGVAGATIYYNIPGDPQRYSIPKSKFTEQWKWGYIESAAEIIGSGNYDAAVALMDDEIREAVHADIAPCTDIEFLAEYMKRHAEKYGVDFVVC